jgi:hypothetical protein
VVESTNVFKQDPGIGGLVLDTVGNPVPNVIVEIRNSTGALLATVSTDSDGWYMWHYKYTGKPTTFTVSLPGYPEVPSQTVTMKSNRFLIVNFTVP